GHRGTAGLVNAVLRRLTTEVPPDPQPEGFENVNDYLGVRYSHPTWIVARFVEAFGAELTEAILAASNLAPQHALRIDTRRASIDEIAAQLEGAGLAVTRSPFADDVLVPSAFVSDDEGNRFVVQSESSAMPVEILAPLAGERILDLCSGRGQKTAQIAARIGDQGTIESIELDPLKARAQQALLERLGITCVALIVGDANGVPVTEDADAVLLDAPCSGLGVLARHPEARWRKAPQDAARLAVMQAELLRRAARSVKPGGRLVYSVCSPDRREGSDVIDAFLGENPAFVLASPPARFAPFLRDGAVLVPPGIEGRDGFYIARCERRG
ncbi:MAG TPA: methyltransferase domain-containing protein, partial [Candidatus Baltobacteraceae bacterium]